MKKGTEGVSQYCREGDHTAPRCSRTPWLSFRSEPPPVLYAHVRRPCLTVEVLPQARTAGQRSSGKGGKGWMILSGAEPVMSETRSPNDVIPAGTATQLTAKPGRDHRCDAPRATG